MAFSSPLPLPLLSPLPSLPSPSLHFTSHLPPTTEHRPGPLPSSPTLTSGFIPHHILSVGDVGDSVPSGDFGPRRPLAGGGGGGGGDSIHVPLGGVGGGLRDVGDVLGGGVGGCGGIGVGVVPSGGGRDGLGVWRGLGVGVGLGARASLWSAGLGLGGRAPRVPRRDFLRPSPSPRPPLSRPPPRYSFVEVVGRCGPLPSTDSSFPSSRLDAVVAARPFTCRALAEAVALVAHAVGDSSFRSCSGPRGGASPFSGLATPSSSAAAPAQVAVKCRPLTEVERRRSRHIIQVTDDKGLVVLDPDLSKDYLDRVQNRTKERKYSFDHVFGPECTNADIYRKVSSTIAGVIQGLNATVFAYGSTGSGKTYTMVGTRKDPGLMVLSLDTIFDLIKRDESADIFEVSCSYLEVYNEVIYDLLEKSSGHLELREDPEHGIIVAGLKSIKVQSADRILELLNLGNSRRKTESTEANATSSRSHAVLEIAVKRKQKKQYRSQILRGKLALVDLAGSERASETNSGGQKLRDGANINRSLLALANCINALGKQQKKGLAYVPYRNSKLTRILKDGLSGNSQTIMVATVSPADDQYHHTVNTLKYADRAKEIKTHIHKNIGTVDTHVADYQRMIDNLQDEVCRLRKELAEKEPQISSKPAEKATDAEMSCLNVLSCETSENVQERINLQKALFELEETNVRNRIELQRLDDAIAKQQAIEKDGTIVQALTSRRQLILDNIRDNDEAGAGYRKDIELNERRHRQLQNMIEEAISNSENNTYLHILSQYRLLGMANTELQFEIAMRDQFIHNQRDAQQKMWNVLLGLGLDQKQIYGLAAKQSIVIEDWNAPHVYFSGKTHLPGLSGQQHASTPSDFQHYEDISSVASLRSTCHSQTLHHQEHRSSYYSLSNDHSHSSSLGTRRHSASGQADTYLYTSEKLAQVPCSYCPPSRYQPCLCSQNCFIPSPCSEGAQQPKDSWLANRRGLQEYPSVGAVEGLAHVESARYGVRSPQPLHVNPAVRSIATSSPQYKHCYNTLPPPSCPDFSKLPVRCASHSEGL